MQNRRSAVAREVDVSRKIDESVRRETDIMSPSDPMNFLLLRFDRFACAPTVAAGSPAAK